MTGGDDRDPKSWSEREKLSFSELDRRRRERRDGRDAPHDGAGQRRSAEAAKQYLKQVDGLFSTSPGGAEGERLASAMREALGTPGLADACRAYRDAVGVPDDPALLSLFLDSGDGELVLAALERLHARSAAGPPALTRGLRSQLRLLADGPDDAIAESAEELLDDAS